MTTLDRPRRVAIVTGHFVPSNLTGVHRSRLWAQHLAEFGWQPVIVTAHWRHYEERLDRDLAALVAPELEVIRTAALPTRPLRLVGDIGIRALVPLYRALADLARRRAIDFVHITVPSNYCALLGRPLHRRYGVPYGIDYQDPWVERSSGLYRPFSKAWLSQRLARLLEPWAVRDGRLITGIAPLYFEDVLARNPALRGRIVTASMPLGGSEQDFEAVRRQPRRTFLFDPADGHFHMIYAGALLPHAFGVLERLFEAIRDLTRTDPALMERFRLHFVGTGSVPTEPSSFLVKPYIERHGLTLWVDEHPNRIGFVDVLNHLTRASAILVLGSTERHYSPSKVFQTLQAGRPILAVLHEDSSAVQMLRASGAEAVVTMAEGALPSVDDFIQALRTVLTGAGAEPTRGRPEALDAWSARESARRLAMALDQALAGAG